MEAQYCIANGYAHNAEVIYGDTDSVMVKFGPSDLAEVMKLGKLPSLLFPSFWPFREMGGQALKLRSTFCDSKI